MRRESPGKAGATVKSAAKKVVVGVMLAAGLSIGGYAFASAQSTPTTTTPANPSTSAPSGNSGSSGSNQSNPRCPNMGGNGGTHNQSATNTAYGSM
jgi:hypothetical protein